MCLCECSVDLIFHSSLLLHDVPIRLYCHVECCRMGDTHGSFHLHLRGLDIKNVEPGPFGLGRSDPFFEVAKKDSDHSIG